MAPKYSKDAFFDLINQLEVCPLDRNSIAQIMNISSASAGKVVSELLLHKIVSEYERKTSSPGRNSSVIHLKRDPVFAIVYIASDKITVNYFGYCLNVSETETISIKEPIFIDDSIGILFKRLSSRSPSLCGICLLCNGYPEHGIFYGSTIRGLDALSLTDMSNEYLPDIITILENSYLPHSDDMSVLSAVIFEENNSLRIYFIQDGSVIRNRSVSSDLTDKIRLSGGRYLSSAIKYAKDFTEYVSVISEFISSVIKLICPEKIYFHSSRYRCTHEITLLITESLILEENISPTILPEIIPFEPASSSSDEYIRKKLRNLYLASLFDVK